MRLALGPHPSCVFTHLIHLVYIFASHDLWLKPQCDEGKKHTINCAERTVKQANVCQLGHSLGVRVKQIVGLLQLKL